MTALHRQHVIYSCIMQNIILYGLIVSIVFQVFERIVLNINKNTDSNNKLLESVDMDKIILYREIYYREIERKNDLEKSLVLPAGLITALCTALFYFITKFNFSCCLWLRILFVILTCLATGCIGVTIYYLFKAYNNFTFGYEYHYIPYCGFIEEYYIDLIDYYSKRHKQKMIVMRKTEERFKKYFIDQYIEKSDENMYNNDMKQSYLYRARVFLIFSLISIFLLVIPYGLNYYNYSNSMRKVIIVNPIRIIK